MTRLFAALLAAAVVALAVPAAASATSSCQTDGIMLFSPPVKAILHGTGGSGVFTWNANATCVVRAPGFSGVTEATLTGSGSYVNLVCGTMDLDGTATLNYRDPAVTDASLRFHIEVVDFHGAMQLTSVNGQPAAGDGALLFTPQDGNCVTTDVATWRVTGSFAYDQSQLAER